jgi:hypothetical protein
MKAWPGTRPLRYIIRSLPGAATPSARKGNSNGCFHSWPQLGSARWKPAYIWRMVYATNRLFNWPMAAMLWTGAGGNTKVIDNGEWRYTLKLEVKQ